MDQYRKTPRAKFLEYNGGDYFITICTKGKKHYFGEIYNSEMVFSELGGFVNQQISMASSFCRNVNIPLFVVMPNHIHLIVNVKDNNEVAEEGYEQRSPNPSYRPNPDEERCVPPLSRYISSLKGAVTKFARSRNIEFDWQSRYYDHYVRGNFDGNNISEYILNNVAKWESDCFYDDNTLK